MNENKTPVCPFCGSPNHVALQPGEVCVIYLRLQLAEITADRDAGNILLASQKSVSKALIEWIYDCMAKVGVPEKHPVTGAVMNPQEQIEWMASKLATSKNALTLCKPFMQFAAELFDKISNTAADCGMGENEADIIEMAGKFGLARQVVYDPTIHGEISDSDPGDKIWWWGDVTDELQKAIAEIRKVLNMSEQNTKPCRGTNCGCTDGVSHSPECKAEHDAPCQDAATQDHINHSGWKCPRCGYEGQSNRPEDMFCSMCHIHR